MTDPETERIWAETCQTILVEGDDGGWNAHACRERLEGDSWAGMAMFSVFLICVTAVVIAMIRKDCR